MTDKHKAEEATIEATDDFVELWRRAKRTVITLSPEAYDEFVKRLEEPAQPNPRLQELMNRKPVWETKTDSAN